MQRRFWLPAAALLLWAVTTPRSMLGQSVLARPTADGSAWVRRTLAGMTIEQKVAQLLTVEASGWYTSSDNPRSAWWRSLARDHGVGSFVFYGGTPRDVAALTNTLQRLAKVPLLIAGDFESGAGQQVSGATEFPANMAFAATRDTALMQRAAEIAAFEGRSMGVHLTYSPAVDISVNPNNPVESVRSFGGDLELLGAMTRAYVRGYHYNGMLTTAKHYPGRGDVQFVAGQTDWLWNPKEQRELVAQEFAAFRHAIRAGVDLVMSEHISLPALGTSQLPASVERSIARTWLRDSLGFKGVLTTDDLWYDHVVRRFGEVEVAIRGFAAGHDMLLKVKNPVATIRTMAAAVRAGRLSALRLDSAVTAVLTLKARLNLHKSRLVNELIVGDRVGLLSHWEHAGDVADRSLTALKNDGVLPFKPEIRRVVNITIQKSDGETTPAVVATRLGTAYPNARSFTFRERVDSATMAEAADSALAADAVIFSLFVQRDRIGEAAPMRERDIAFIDRIVTAKPGAVVVMSYGNPYLIRKLPNVPAFLVGYGERGWFGNQEIYVGAFLRAVRGEIGVSGQLPVHVSHEYPIGAGLTWKATQPRRP